jgi:iron(III) transport system substrate-binding protein
MAHRGFFVTGFFVFIATSVFAQQLRPFSADEIEYLLRQSVAHERVTALVNERGVGFSLTNSLREQLRKAGADAALLDAIGRAASRLTNRNKSETLKMAKSEAKVVWYSSLQSPLSEELCNRFNSKNLGITCVVHRSGSGNLYRRLAQETQSRAYTADIIHTSNIDDFVRLRREGALLRYRPDGIETFDAAFLEKDGHWAISRAGLFVPAYNTRNISRNDIPKSWLDFLDPKFNAVGLAMGDPISSGFVNVGLVTLAKQFGWSFLDKLAARNPRILPSAVDAMNELRSGGAPMLFGGVSYSLYQEIMNRAPIAYGRPKEGVPFIVSPQAILAHAPHPNAAMVFTDWLFTKEVQQILADKGHYVGHRDITYPNDQLPLRDFTLLTISQGEPSVNYERARKEFLEKILPKTRPSTE